MTDSASTHGRYTIESYHALGESGVLGADDRTELLRGLIVAMAPPAPSHDNTVHRVLRVLQRKLGLDVMIRVQSTFLVGDDCSLLPDLAVCPGDVETYEHRHPTRAHLLVEVAFSSLPQDRLTKSAIYARAGVPCYWIVNLRDLCVEVYRKPDRWKSEYRSVTSATGSDALVLDDFPDVTFEAAELLPPAAAD